MRAAATLPLIAALSMIAGRRGNASFCIGGSHWLLCLCCGMAISGPLWFALDYLLQVLPYQAGLERALAPLFEQAGVAWSGSFVVWLAGLSCALLALRSLGRFARHLNVDSYPVRAIRSPLILAFLAAFLFFSTFMIALWPFAGLPEGLDWERAGLAIWRRASSAYFQALCPAGAIALAMWPLWRPRLELRYTGVACRWLAFWAMVGALPYLLTAWGPVLGAARRGATLPGLHLQSIDLGALTLATTCWIFLLWKPSYLAFLSLFAMGMLLLRSLLPFVLT